MRRTDFGDMPCGIGRALDILGDAWTLLIVREALFGATTFQEFHRYLQIPKNTLTTRLRDLVERGVLAESIDDNGRRREYALTARGRDLWPVMLALQQWGNRWLFDGEGPPSYMADRATLQPLAELAPADQNGRPVSLDGVTMIPGPSAPAALVRRFVELD
jgi:DNA-binding HxlR family transcriptional regulator